MPIHSRLSGLAAALLLCLAACTAQPTDSAPPIDSAQPGGSVQFVAYVPQALTASDVTRIKVTVSAADMASITVDLAKTNGVWGGVIGNIPAGSNRSFLAEAFDSTNTQRFQGQTSNITITANQTAAVAITLQERVPPPAYGNEAPLIDSIVASITTVPTGGTVSLTATVRDPNTGDTLTYAWTATGGTFSNPAATGNTWTAPATTGIQTLTFTVTDSQGAAGAVSLAINVISGTSTGSAATNVSFNLFPVVSKVSASRTRADVGQSIAVTANAADADADALSYQWSAVGCTGTWANATSSGASFVPSAIPSGACNNCQLTVTVQDGRGGQGTGSINLCVAAATTERFAPTFTNSYQSATATSPGQTATLSVAAMDPQSSALTFSWTANIGSLAPAQSTTSTSQVGWTAPSCAVTGTPASITAFATNAYGVWASKTLSFSGLPACASGWTTAGSLATGRQSPSVTLLYSGKVLVVGGAGSSGILAAAEVYDPASNSWSSAGTLAVARRYHTATLLPSGKVLVVGGAGNIASAEVYDPATNSWSAAAPLATGRQYHTATLLSSGKVLVAGGSGNSGTLSSVEVYDPATNTWSSANPLATARYLHTATFLSSSGKVLVVGGVNNNGSNLSGAEMYNPATNSWSPAGAMETARYLHTAAVLSSGKVLIVGGHNGGALSSVEVYDPANNFWTTVSPLTTARYYHTVTVLGSGRVLAAGGYNNNGNLAAVEVYNPAGNSWSSITSMTTARYIHAATLLSSGKVLITGGFNADTSVNVFATEIYTP
jgi:hypothetical protein